MIAAKRMFFIKEFAPLLTVRRSYYPEAKCYVERLLIND